jgi:signal recognition particle subunit SRP54
MLWSYLKLSKIRMFESLTSRLEDVFRNLNRRGKLRESDIDDALKEIRFALLEADVHFQVVKEIISAVRQEALGAEVARALKPGQQVVKIIHRALIETLGEPERLNLTGPTPRVVMLVGLQGSGKTTTTAKLAKHLRSRGERVLMVAADPYRPAAVDQLVTLGSTLHIPVFSDPEVNPVDLSDHALGSAEKDGTTVVLFDTAGRSQLDDEMMDELRSISARVNPAEVLLVADAMTGQEAIHIAGGFNQAVGLTGLILTKMDGDARGGAAISMRAATGVPIKYIGTGEALDSLETFEPDRIASRILGMGDVLTLIEKAEAVYEQDQAEEQVSRLLSGEFTFEDYATQLTQMERLGPLDKILEMMPGGLSKLTAQVDSTDAERKLIHSKAIIQSMTVRERRKPDILNGRRKRRIAAGSGTTVQEVNQLIRSYRQMKKMFKMVGKGGLKGFLN